MMTPYMHNPQCINLNCVVLENIHTNLKEGRWKFQGGDRGGVAKATIFKGKYESKPEFPKGWRGGGQTKKILCGRGMATFWNNK